MHRQVAVKVTALVDEGVAELVEALNRIDGVRTLESCQGHADYARVLFVVGNETNGVDLGLFLHRFVPILEPFNGAHVDWFCPGYWSGAWLHVHRNDVGALTLALSTLSDPSHARTEKEA
jgi:hypothetical protein